MRGSGKQSGAMGPVFLREFLRHPQSIGAIAPSSAALARRMLTAIGLPSRRTIVEFGPGTGAFTRLVAAALAPGQAYLGIERSGAFVQRLRRDFPALRFEQDSVENLEPILARHGLGPVDAVLCGLPWASLPIPVQDRVFAALRRTTQPGAVFATFAYLQGLLLPGAWALRRRLQAEFPQVRTSPVVWRNLPPAFVYICER